MLFGIFARRKPNFKVENTLVDSDSKIKSIKCIEVRKFYDSTWDIELKSGETCRIVRDDLETEADLRGAIEKCSNAEEIRNTLDMRTKIYYD
jgi:hypothetical protein